MTKQFDIDFDALNVERKAVAFKIMDMIQNSGIENVKIEEAIRFADSMSRVLVLAGAAIRNTNEILADDGKMLNEEGMKICLTAAVNLDVDCNKNSIFKKKVA